MLRPEVSSPRTSAPAGLRLPSGLAVAAAAGTLALAVAAQVVWAFASPEVSAGAERWFHVVTAVCIAGTAFQFAWHTRSERRSREREYLFDLEAQARRDELTGLANHRAMREEAARALDTARIEGSPLALVMIDLNNFKDVNDRFGHQAGDGVLRAIGSALRATVNDRGIAARYGGDEFMLMLPGNARQDAEALAERVAEGIRDAATRALPENRHLPVTGAFGIAVYPEDGDEVSALIAQADAKLYAAKSRLVETSSRSDERHAQDVFFALAKAMGASLDPQQLITNVVQAVAATLDLDACSLWLQQPDGSLGVRAYYTRERELAEAFARALAAEPLCFEQARGRGLLGARTIYVDDVHASDVWDDRFRRLLPQDMWMLSVPIDTPRPGMLLLGARHAVSAPPSTSLAEAVAGLAAAAIRNAETFARAQRQAEQLSALAGIGGLLFGEGDFEERMHAVVRRIADVLDCEMLTFDMPDPTGQRPFLRQYVGREPDGSEQDDETRDIWLQLRPALTEPGVSEFLVQLTGPIVLDDPASQVPDLYREVVLASGTKYAVVVPVQWQGELNGLMYFASRRENAFDDQDVALMRAIAAQLAPSVQVAKLHHDLAVSYAGLKESHREAILRLAYAAEARDPYTGRHLQRIGALSEAIARRIGFDAAAVEAIGYAAIVHDLGKLKIPDDILTKPGELTEEDWREMRKHPQFGADLLGADLFGGLPREVALHHHERWDGSGYPFGLAEEAIPLAARVVAVADVYDALISARPYKRPWPRERALAELLKMRGTKLCPRSVDAFLQLWSEGEVARIEAETEGQTFEADFRDRRAA